MDLNVRILHEDDRGIAGWEDKAKVAATLGGGELGDRIRITESSGVKVGRRDLLIIRSGHSVTGHDSE